MKIQIDTKEKTIKVENDVKLSVLVDFLEEIFPDNKWKEYKLLTETVIHEWRNPVVIKYPYYQPSRPIYPYGDILCNYEVNV